VVELIDGSRVTSVAGTVFDLGGVMDAQGPPLDHRGHPEQGAVLGRRAR
jgi:hypothetical protein